MNTKILRGAKEIGGTIVELSTENTTIYIDLGFPLVDGSRKELKLSLKDQTRENLTKLGILPEVPGLTVKGENLAHGLLISHAHLDHYGLLGFLNRDVPIYMGEATERLVNITTKWCGKSDISNDISNFKSGEYFKIGDFKITPYLADHSAFDAYSFLIEADGEKVLYTGDFRNHGRKSKCFEYLLRRCPQGIDAIICEGTTIGNERDETLSEAQIEDRFVEIIKDQKKATLVTVSGQNIDRLVGLYRACIKTDKTLVLDVYTAKILGDLKDFAKIPYAHKSFKNLAVFYTFNICRKIVDKFGKDELYKHRSNKISLEEMKKHPEKYVVIDRFDIERIFDKHLKGKIGTLIYSQWFGYMKNGSQDRLVKFMKRNGIKLEKVHTSGHATPETIKELVDTLKPKYLIPIHTFHAEGFREIYKDTLILSDNETFNFK